MMIFRLVSLFIVTINISLHSWSATNEVHFSKIVEVLYQGSTSKAIAEQERNKFEILKSSANRFSSTELSITPYIVKYNLRDVPTAYSGQQNGLRLGLLQNTIYGLKLNAAIDKKNENDLSLNSNEKIGSSLGLSIPLWQNYLGYADRLQQESLYSEAELGQLEAEVKLRQSCEDVTLNLMTYWSLQQKDIFFKELVDNSKNLNKVLEKSRLKGELSKIDFIMAQSELLSIENQKIQNDRQISVAELQLKKETSSTFNLKSLSIDPQKYFDYIWNEYKKNGPSETLASLKLIKAHQSNTSLIDSLKNKNRTTVDLNLQANQHAGVVQESNYQDDDFKAEVNLVFKFNDNNEKAELGQAIVKAKQSLEILEQNNRAQSLNYEMQVQDLEYQIKENQNLSKRLDYLILIKNEYLKRFSQGRIDYQEYLRQKETWTHTALQLIDNRINTWNTIVKSYHAIHRLGNICEKRTIL